MTGEEVGSHRGERLESLEAEIPGSAPERAGGGRLQLLDAMQVEFAGMPGKVGGHAAREPFQPFEQEIAAMT
jgi:hypothetical protein